MSAEALFQTSSTIAMVSWLLMMVLSPFWFGFDKLFVGIIITLLALLYLWLIFQSFSPSGFSEFGSLEGVMRLFTNKTMVVAGWVHYLAFDLFLGVWIKKNSVKYSIPHWLIIPCLFFTFMLGPIGLLLYLLIRWLFTRKYFSENF